MGKDQDTYKNIDIDKSKKSERSKKKQKRLLKYQPKTLKGFFFFLHFLHFLTFGRSYIIQPIIFLHKHFSIDFF